MDVHTLIKVKDEALAYTKAHLFAQVKALLEVQAETL